MSLVEKRCVPCRGGIPPLPREDAEQLLAETPGWSLDDGLNPFPHPFP